MPQRILALILLAASLSASALATPHVLFIAIDDLNDWIGCLEGHPQALTPNIDRLASRGTLFTNAHCAAPACNPSRAAVFSGRLPAITKVWSNRSGSIDKLYQGTPLLPASFKRAGYQTLGTGKLLHGGGKAHFDTYHDVEQRWSPFTKNDVAYTTDELPTKGTDTPRHLLKDRFGREVILPINQMPSDRRPSVPTGESFDWGGFELPDKDFGDTKITDWAIAQLEEMTDTPTFLALGYYRPHIPLWAPQRFFDRFKQDPGKLPNVPANDLEDLSEVAKQWAREPVTAGSHATVVQHKQWQAAVEAYLACITYVDHEIGRLLDSLAESPRAQNTLIILWSDHGWHLGEKEHWGKWTGWERSTRVPLIVAPPIRSNEFATGTRCNQPVSLIDLYPTLSEICSLPNPGRLDGQSLVPLLRDPTTISNRSVITYFDPGNESLRTERWRYIRYQNGAQELYDLRNDPNEWHNRAPDPSFSQIKSSLANLLNQESRPR